MPDRSAYPWGEFLSPEDFVSTENGLPVGAYLDLFQKKTFPAIDPAVGNLRYYVYDPVAHGADPAKRYPLLYWFHGAGNALAGDLVLPYSGAERFASPDFQRLMGGAYIVCPVANETADEQGNVRDGWMTSVPLDPPPVYRKEDMARIRAYTSEADRFFIDMHYGDSVYEPTLKALLDSLRADFPSVDSVYLAGTSAGGYAAWRFLIDYPQAVDACLLMAAAYLVPPAELDRLEKLGTPIWLIHSLHDEVIVFDGIVAPNLPKLQSMPNVSVTALPFARYGDHGVASNNVGSEIGQHCVCTQVAQNMLYNDGTPYDPAHPDGVTGWVRGLHEKRGK